MAVTCGTPTPATTRVVQIEPGPTPTLTPSAPASISAWAPERVATLPPITSTWAALVSPFSRAIMSVTPRACPLAVSTTSRSTPASIRDIERSQESPKKPTAAPTRSLPASSFVESGNCSVLVKSLTVNKPRNLPSASTIGSFSILLTASRCSASSLSMPTGPVTNPVAVITSATERPWSFSNRMSRLVMMPISRPSSSTTGRPEIRKRPHSASICANVACGPIVTGSVTMPFSDRFTRSTCAA